MNIRNTLLMLCALGTCSAAKAQTGLYVPELAVYDTAMLKILKDYDVPGGQLAVTYQGRLVYNRGFGLADTQSKKLVQPNSIFRIASASKAVTSIALMHLWEQKKFKLDDTVFGLGGILNEPMYQTAIDARYFNITVRQLMSHSAGFSFPYPTDPLFETYNIAIASGLPAPTDSLALVISWAMKNKALNYTPGTSAQYTNFAFGVLGKVIQKLSGKKYETYVRDSILAPLNIQEMYAGRTLQKDTLPNEVSYYNYAGAPLGTSIYTGIPNSVPTPYGVYNYEIMTPAGGWVAAAQDLCKLLVAVDKFTTKPDMLLPATIDTMTRSLPTWANYALGWNVKPGSKDYWHTGGVEGTASIMKRNETQQLTWAVIFNGLPKVYTPMYFAFMDMVTDSLAKITKWPTHDLFPIPTAIAGLQHTSFFSVFPNPSTGKMVLSSSHYISAASVYSQLGELVYSAPDFKNQKTIDLSHLATGIYYLQLKDAHNNLAIERLIKE